jgi:hypothetical protein
MMKLGLPRALAEPGEELTGGSVTDGSVMVGVVEGPGRDDVHAEATSTMRVEASAARRSRCMEKRGY